MGPGADGPAARLVPVVRGEGLPRVQDAHLDRTDCNRGEEGSGNFLSTRVGEESIYSAADDGIGGGFERDESV